MHLELNFKMLMTKMGVTPANEIPPQVGRSETPTEGVANSESEDMDVDEGRRDLGGEFTLTEEEFDGDI